MKKINLFRLLSLVFLLNEGAVLHAQNITGKVTDEQQRPMQFANVVLLQRSDSAFVKGCITDSVGMFRLTGQSGCQYLLKISSVGYGAVWRSVSSDEAVGTVTMKPDDFTLNEVVVKGNLPTTRMKGGALVTSVENSFLSHAGTANDVLLQVPMVTGRDGEFEVFGKGTPLIYINGRLVRDMSELSQLNSQDIRSVEVITNPGARYDASVKSVIRIRTRRPQGEGFSGTLRSNNGFARYFHTGNQVDLKYRTRGLELFTTWRYDEGKDYATFENDMLTRSTTLWQQVYEETTRIHNRSIFGKIGFDYMINENHSIGAYYQNRSGKGKSYSDYHSDILSDGIPYDSWSTDYNAISRRVPNHLANVYYNGTVGKLGLDFNMDYLWNKSRKSSFNDEQSENFDDAEVETRSLSRSRLFAEKLVLSYPLGKGEIEIGQEYTNSRLESGFTTTASLTDATTQVDENNTAFFLQLSQQLGRLNVSAGLRYEHVNFDYYVDGQHRPEQSKTYDNLFPSLSLSTQIGKVQTSLSYSNKTVRPDYARLDGTVNYVNRFTYQSGNPYLKPTTLHTVELMAAWKMFFAQISYCYAKDPIYNATQPYADDERIQLITFDNFSRNRTLNAFVGANLQWGIWQPRLFPSVLLPA